MSSQEHPSEHPLDNHQQTRPFSSLIAPPLSQPSLSTSSSTTTTSESSLEEPLQNLSLDSPKYPSKDHPNTLGQSSEAYDILHPTPANHNQQMERHPAVDPNDPRPILHHRTTSYSKRHASFDTPREVPLPYMPSREEEGSYPRFSSTSSSHAQPFSSSALSPSQGDEQNGRSSIGAASNKTDGYPPCEHNAGSTSNGLSNGSSPSGLSAVSPPYSAATQGRPHSPLSPTPCYADMMDVDGPDNFSLPPHHSQQPHPHPHCQQQRSISGPVPPFSRPFSSPDASRIGAVSPGIHSPTPVQSSEVPDRSSTASLPLPMLTPYHTLPSLPGMTIHEGREMGDMADQPSSSQPQAGPSHAPQSQTYNRRQPPYARSTSPTTAYSPSRFSRSHFHRRDWYNENDSEPHQDHSLAFESAGSSSSPFAAATFRDHRALTSSSSIPSGRSMPPPAPPVILTPPPPPTGEQSGGGSDSGPVPPHVPFLSHGPPSREVYIAVETLLREYRLIVRLPGYRRDSITLSTRKRRILHLVADSWEPEGGHFERRISFGYDADLAQVRAEFDGELLRVIVPRKVAPMTYWSSRD